MHIIKKISYYLLLVIALVSTASATEENVSLVLDALNSKQLPKNFRTSSKTLPSNLHLNLQGFNELNMAGSAQFSQLQLQEALTKLKTPLIIVDLRQESHGFINGHAISWYGEHNWANVGKTDAQIKQEEVSALARLATEKTVAMRKTNSDGDEGAKVSKYIVLTVKPKTIITEEQLAKELGLGYERIYVTDRRAPQPKEVDRFLNFVKSAHPGTVFYFHCRQGVGRTTTFMIMYDILRNAKQVSYNDIIKRNIALGYKNILHIPAKNNFKYPYAVERLSFLKLFYQYVATNHDNFKTSWTEWLAKQSR